MAGPAGLNWSRYLRGRRDDETHALAAWLATEGLGVPEFMEVVDRAYATAPRHGRGPTEDFVVRFGRPAAEIYARRKWRFAGLVAAYELALMSGALRGEVAPEELDPCVSPRARGGRADELVGALERAMHGQA
jgi:hypothetical protein